MFRLTLLFVLAGCSPLKHTHANDHYHNVDDHYHEETQVVQPWGGYVEDPWGSAKNPASFCHITPCHRLW